MSLEQYDTSSRPSQVDENQLELLKDLSNLSPELLDRVRQAEKAQEDAKVEDAKVEDAKVQTRIQLGGEAVFRIVQAAKNPPKLQP